MKNVKNLIQFGGSVFMIDIDAFDKAITLNNPRTAKPENLIPAVDVEKRTTVDSEGKILSIEVIEKTYGKVKEVDAVKYDLLKMFVEYLMDYDDVADDSLGVERALGKAPLGFKVIFNTLVENNVLKELE